MPNRYRSGEGYEDTGDGFHPFRTVTDRISDAVTPETDLLRRAGFRGELFGRQGQREFGDLREGLGTTADMLRRQATGELSLSSEQLRQGLQQNLAAQQSFAAGARPANQAMAARTAAIQMGRLGSGFTGQQATAGIQERQAAQQALANLYLQQRQQALQAALGGYGLQTQAGGAIAGVPTTGQILLGGAQALGSAALGA